MTPDIIVSRVVLRLLRTIDAPEKIETLVRRILPRVDTLSARWELLTVVGHRENTGHQLVSAETAAELEKQFRAQVREADASALADEPNLLRVLLDLRRDAEPSEPSYELPVSRELDVALLRATLTDTVSQSFESRAVHREKRLYWNPLVEVAGGEDAVRQMIERVRSITDDEELQEVIALAERYLSGWRPEL